MLAHLLAALALRVLPDRPDISAAAEDDTVKEGLSPSRWRSARSGR